MIRELAQGFDGLVTIAGALPGQAFRTLDAIRHIPMGDDNMSQNYYFGNPQIFKMPRKFRQPGPPLTPGLGAYKEDSLTKALPYIAVGVAGIVAYNVFTTKVDNFNYMIDEASFEAIQLITAGEDKQTAGA